MPDIQSTSNAAAASTALRRDVLQRYDRHAPARLAGGGNACQSRGHRLACGHDAIDAVGMNERSVVHGQGGFKQRKKRIARQRARRGRGDAALNPRIDDEGFVEEVTEQGLCGFIDTRIGKVDGVGAAFKLTAIRTRRGNTAAVAIFDIVLQAAGLALGDGRAAGRRRGRDGQNVTRAGNARERVDGDVTRARRTARHDQQRHGGHCDPRRMEQPPTHIRPRSICLSPATLSRKSGVSQALAQQNGLKDQFNFRLRRYAGHLLPSSAAHRLQTARHGHGPAPATG